MNQFFRSKWLGLFALCFLLYPGFAHAQATSGDVTGTVLDASGAGIPNASVIATNVSTGVKTPAETNASGVYRFNNLLVGTYSITATAKGFSTDKLENVEVVLNNVITANLTLPVGGTATTVEVSAGAAQIDTTTAQLQTTFNTQEVMELPATASNSGSGIYNLSLLGSGVSSSGGIGQGFGPVIAGQRPDNNSFNLDGISNNSYYDPAPIVYVSNEAVGEFTLLQNQFAPEFGGGSGGIFNAVVKSGTNQIHGDIYEYLLNRNLDAVNSQTAANGNYSNPRYDNNRLGATIGGPIIKNKLFYFGNFEYNPIGAASQPGAPFYTPTAAGYSILNSIAGLSQTNLQQMQKYLPAAPVNDQGFINVLGQQIPIGTYSAATPSYTNNYDAVVAIDYNMSDKDQIRGRWIYNKSSTLSATDPGIPAFNIFIPNNNYMYNMSEFHNFAPTLQNEFRVSYSRNVNSSPNAAPEFPGLSAYPVLTIDELNATWGNPGASGSTQGLFQVQDNMTKVIGRNTIKFGGNFIDMIATNYFIQRVTGNYEYSTAALYLQDLSPDVYGERSAGATSYPVGFLQSAAFVNDDFRIRPNLTLNLGLRYEYVTVPVASRYQEFSSPANIYGGPTFARPYYSPNNLMPRVGFAYSPGTQGNWSIRGGFSKAYDLTYSNLTANAAPPYFQQTNDVNLSNQTPGFLASGGLPGSAVPLSTNPTQALAPIGSYTFGGSRPYALSWNLGVQHVFLKNYTFEARYVGTRGVHLWNQTQLNFYPLVSANNYIPTFLTMPSAATLASLGKTLGDVENYITPGGTADDPYNSYAALGSQAKMTTYAPQANSLYNGLALQLNRRFSNGLAFIAAYTWSHAEDDATATNFSTYLTPRRAQNVQDLKADWSNSAFDHRQRFTFTPIYDVTVFKDKNWLLKNIVGNWVVSGTYTYETPEYATIQSGIDSNLNDDAAGDRTIVNPAGASNMGTGVTAYNAAGQIVGNGATGDPTTVAYVANSTSARYVQAGYGALANGGRNTFPLRPIDNIDVQLKKNFNITERFQLSLGAQFYNIFNHPQWTGGSTNDAGTFGFTVSRNFLEPSNPAFANVSEYLNSNSRVVQVFGKFTF